jgi:hypothetical protein
MIDPFRPRLNCYVTSRLSSSAKKKKAELLIR